MSGKEYDELKKKHILFLLYTWWLLFLRQENGQLAERQANEHFECLFEVLQERKSEMLRSIEQSRNRRTQQLKTQVRLKSS